MITLRDVLALPSVRSANPVVLAGRDQLDTAVRWVHTTELSDIGPLLRSGDLVLTTGIALPEEPARLAAFAHELAESNVTGLFLELGRRWKEAPEPLVDAFERAGLPLVALRREVRFAAVAQAVGERVVDSQVAQLRDAQRVHDVFTQLSISEAKPAQILDAVQQLSGATVVLEDEQNQILDFRRGPGDLDDFLDDWTRRSTRLNIGEPTAWDSSNGWLVTRLGKRERAWGRLIIGSPSEPTERLRAVAERAAAALAMHRLHDRSKDSHVRRLHHELLLSLLINPNDPDLQHRAHVAGIPASGRKLAGLSVRPVKTTGRSGSLSTQLDELVAALVHAAETSRVRILVAAFESDVRALVSAPGRGDLDTVIDKMIAQVQGRTPVIAAVGPAVAELAFADRTLRDALHVQSVAGKVGRPGDILRLADLHIRGLLALFVDDERMQSFAHRELGALIDAGRTEELASLQVIIECWDNKARAATQLNLSRPGVYARIGKLETLLGVDLAAPETRTSLHVALMIHGAGTLDGGREAGR